MNTVVFVFECVHITSYVIIVFHPFTTSLPFAGSHLLAFSVSRWLALRLFRIFFSQHHITFCRHHCATIHTHIYESYLIIHIYI